MPTIAGWYRDPTMAGTRRYWDGQAWTENVAPVASGQEIDTWKGIRIVALGVLAAISAAYLLFGR